MLFKSNQTVLFTGDSITDTGRVYDDPQDLGKGYVLHAAGYVRMKYPQLDIRFINRGIAGESVYGLAARMEQDCRETRPDWVSIMIGANDVWRDWCTDNPQKWLSEFETEYRKILDTIRMKTSAKVILMDVFVLQTPEDRIYWRRCIDERVSLIRRLAAEYGALYIPIDGLLNAAAIRTEPSYWALASDGVHPTLAGHAFIAHEWLKAVGAA